jgi:hypothetical protein
MRHTAAVCLVILFGSACVVGEAPPDPDPDVSAGPDGGGDPTPDAGGDDVECIPAATTLPFGNHNSGAACLGCHTGQSAAPRWTLAGTLFDSRQGTAPLPGATISIVDAAGVELTLVTASNGNFYTQQPLTFPVTVSASKCPDTKAMTGKPGSGDCNSCHTANASQGRIHLP